MTKIILTPQQAYDLVHSPDFTLAKLKTAYVSEHFTWKEVFTGCTQAEVKSAKILHFTNAKRQSAKLEKIRAYLCKLLGEITMVVSSWWRSAGKNAKVGGAKESQHMLALATDWEVPGYAAARIQALIIGKMKEFGFCLEITNGPWTHADSRANCQAFENYGNREYSSFWTPAQVLAFQRKHGVAA